MQFGNWGPQFSLRCKAAVPTSAVLRAIDATGTEVGFVGEQVRNRGRDTSGVGLGAIKEPSFEPDVTRQGVASAAGEQVDILAQTEPAMPLGWIQ